MTRHLAGRLLHDNDTVGECDGVGPTLPLGAINRASTHWPSLRLAFSGQFANSII